MNAQKKISKGNTTSAESRYKLVDMKTGEIVTTGNAEHAHVKHARANAFYRQMRSNGLNHSQALDAVVDFILALVKQA